jgi:aspartate/methionine/tyrosine aminotransferase
MNLIDHLRTEARRAPGSGISAVADRGRGRADVIPLWVGEGDLPTPAFIADAAERALAGGETFYTWQRGIPDLREALARYHGRHFGRAFAADEFLVTGGGMQAIQLALQATAGAGNEVIYLAPAWPNFPGAAGVAGAKPVPVALDFGSNGWSCDIGRIEKAVTPRTRAIFFNSPSNPTGWTADQDTLRAVLDLVRRHGLWIIADEIYALFHYGGRRAASFLDIMEPDDRILFVNTFSKNWAMTGWRIGWLKVHPSLQQTFENPSSIRRRAWRNSCNAAPSRRWTRATASSPSRWSGRGKRAISSAASSGRPAARALPCRRARSISSLR